MIPLSRGNVGTECVQNRLLCMLLMGARQQMNPELGILEWRAEGYYGLFWGDEMDLCDQGCLYQYGQFIQQYLVSTDVSQS